MEQNQELLAQLNQFTRREHTAEEVYLFDVILCDNDIDRDGDRFSDAALDTLAKRAVGATGIFDHNPKSGNQTARIFRAEVCTDAECRTKSGQPYRFLKANAYMVRTDGNADLIREIDAGIKKEVSVSCAVTRQVCSVCGTNRIEKPCRHLKGKRYGDTLCYFTLDGISDFYEWSFVAVPAQPRAGVTKTCGAARHDTEKELLYTELAGAADLLDRMTEHLRREVIRLCYKGGDTPCAKALAESAAEMDTEHLLLMRERLSAEAHAPAAAIQPAQLADYQTGKGELL